MKQLRKELELAQASLASARDERNKAEEWAAKCSLESYQLKKERDELNEYKEEIENSFKFIMTEICDANELHCTCVPFLKTKVEHFKNRCSMLEQEILSYKNEIQGWENKWKCAVEIAAIAQNKLDNIQNIL